PWMQFRRFRWSSSRCLPCCRRRLMTWISKKVKELISYDNTIAALCLRVANSPLFGRRTVETVSEAIVALGMKRVQSIVLSCTLTQVVPASQWAMDAVTYWRHCFGLCPGLPQDGHAHRLARHRKSLPGWATARPGHSGEFASLYRRIRACLQYASSSCVSID